MKQKTRALLSRSRNEIECEFKALQNRSKRLFVITTSLSVLWAMIRKGDLITKEVRGADL